MRKRYFKFRKIYQRGRYSMVESLARELLENEIMSGVEMEAVLSA